VSLVFAATKPQSRLELFLMIAVLALVAVTPLGHEGTSGPVFIAYRLLLVSIICGFLYSFRYKEDPEICPIFVSLCGIYLVLMLVSLLLNSGSRFDGFYIWYQTALLGAGFLTIAAGTREWSAKLKRVVLYGIVVIDLAYFAAALIIGRRPFLVSFVNPNYYASFLLVGFSVAVAATLFETRRRLRISGGAAAILLYYGMTQAWSRGATMAAIAVAMLATIRFCRERKLSRAAIAVILAIVVAAGAVASPVLVRKFLDRGNIDPYNYQRPKIWLAALQIIGAHPLLGVGPGEFYYISKRYSPPVEGTIARYLKRPAIAHSEYLQYAAEAGLPAALLLFTLAGYLVRTAFQRVRRMSPNDRLFQEAAILVAIGLGLHALVDNNWTTPVMAAGLIVFALGDVLPLRDWHFPLRWSPRLLVSTAALLVIVVIHGILVPGLAVSLNQAGEAAYSRQDLERAESMHRLAAALAPANTILLTNAGMVYLDRFITSHNSHWLDAAERLFDEAAATNPNADQPLHYLERVEIQRLTGDPLRDRPIHRRIIEVNRRLLVIDPVNPFVRRNLAEALYNIGDRQGAEGELRRALSYEPNYVPAYLRLAEWFMEAGDTARSEQYRQRGMAVAVKYRNEKPTEAYESLLLGRPASPAAEIR